MNRSILVGDFDFDIKKIIESHGEPIIFNYKEQVFEYAFKVWQMKGKPENFSFKIGEDVFSIVKFPDGTYNFVTHGIME
jgi:hypothetical protein